MFNNNILRLIHRFVRPNTSHFRLLNRCNQVPGRNSLKYYLLSQRNRCYNNLFVWLVNILDRHDLRNWLTIQNFRQRKKSSTHNKLNRILLFLILWYKTRCCRRMLLSLKNKHHYSIFCRIQIFGLIRSNRKQSRFRRRIRRSCSRSRGFPCACIWFRNSLSSSRREQSPEPRPAHRYSHIRNKGRICIFCNWRQRNKSPPRPCRKRRKFP